MHHRDRLLSSSQVGDWGTSGMVIPSRREAAMAFDARAYDAANLVLWLSAQAPNGINGDTPAADAALRAWVDLSGNGNHQVSLDPTSGTHTYRAAGLGTSIPAIEIGGTVRTISNTDIAFPQSWTAYVVADSAGSSGTRGLVNADDGGGSRQAQILRWNADTLESIAFDTGGSAYTASKASTGSAKHLLVARASQAATEVQVWVDNAAGTAATTGGTLRALTTNMQLNRAGTDTSGTACLYGEVILYGAAHDTTTRESIQTAIASYYGITLS